MTPERQLDFLAKEYNRIDRMLRALKEGAASIQLDTLSETLVITDVFPNYKPSLERDLQDYLDIICKKYKEIKEAITC